MDKIKYPISYHKKQAGFYQEKAAHSTEFHF